MASDPSPRKQAQGAASVLQTTTEGSLLDAIVENGRLGQTREEKSKNKGYLKELVDQVLEGQIKVDADTDRMLGQRIKEIDELLSAQLNEVMHSQELQKLEGAWRGLQYLVFNTDTSTMLKIKVLNVTKKDILKDFTKQNDWEAATIFKKVYEEGHGTLGGEPFGCLVGDYEITRHPEDVQLLTNMSNVDGRDHKKYLWGNAAYALATRITDAFAKHEWCAAIRGVEGGGLVEGLPAHTFQTDDGDYTVKCPTEIAITDRRENELSQLGFIPLSHYKGTTNAVFMATQSANQPTKYLDADANANARLSSQLQYIFAVSRFAHFLNAMMRDKIGSFMSREQCQKFLNEWIQHYVLLDDFASQDAKAKFPLREAQIEVTEDA